MTQLVAWIVFTSIAISIGSILLSIVRPDWRTWPPPRESRWPQWVNPVRDVVGQIGMFGLLSLGILDWDSFLLDHWAWTVAGGALLVGGGLLGFWGFATLGVHASRGHESPLVRTGAYRYCRNPQYMGAIAGFTGYAIVCNSFLALIAAGLGAVGFALMPFAEEPWLRERVGARYEAYSTGSPDSCPAPRPTRVARSR